MPLWDLRSSETKKTAQCIILYGERRSARLRERRSLKEPSIGTGMKQMVKHNTVQAKETGEGV